MAKLICVKLEPCDDNPDGSSWYGYWDGKPTYKEWAAAFDDKSKIDKVSKQALGWMELEDFDDKRIPTQDPNLLSRYAKLNRYFVRGAG